MSKYFCGCVWLHAPTKIQYEVRPCPIQGSCFKHEEKVSTNGACRKLVPADRQQDYLMKKAAIFSIVLQKMFMPYQVLCIYVSLFLYPWHRLLLDRLLQFMCHFLNLRHNQFSLFSLPVFVREAG